MDGFAVINAGVFVVPGGTRAGASSLGLEAAVFDDVFDERTD